MSTATSYVPHSGVDVGITRSTSFSSSSESESKPFDPISALKSSRRKGTLEDTDPEKDYGKRKPGRKPGSGRKKARQSEGTDNTEEDKSKSRCALI